MPLYVSRSICKSKTTVDIAYLGSMIAFANAVPYCSLQYKRVRVHLIFRYAQCQQRQWGPFVAGLKLVSYKPKHSSNKDHWMKNFGKG